MIDGLMGFALEGIGVLFGSKWWALEHMISLLKYCNLSFLLL